ncbi:MAG: cation-translocating P-type ATPase [Planctomycetes bacterium]|nr:cation-translocating P-type ATPase [Planctomycetota bacterium]
MEPVGAFVNALTVEASEGPIPFAVPAGAVADWFKTDPQHGLRAEQVDSLRQTYAYNELVELAPRPAWKRFFAQFNELVIWILIGAAVISGLLGEWADAVAILAIVLLNGVLGFFQEERAEQSLVALRKLSAPLAKVLRGGVLRSIPARELVPGDLLELEAGDRIPADARLTQAFGLRVQEAALTGESAPVDKDADRLLPPSTALGDRRNMVYMSTVVSAGKASALVVATGMQTELGRIAGMLQRYEPEPTPLQRRLAELGKILLVACLAIVFLISVLQMLRGGGFLEVFMLAISLAVAAVPEGLPAVVTVALALGLQRMVKRNALVRKLPSVETLGSVTVICSDKTGTLTRNEMTVREIVAGGQRYGVTGIGYAPQGEFSEVGATLTEPTASAPQAPRKQGPRVHPDLHHALVIAAKCNNARLTPEGDGEPSWQVIGDPTEGALLVAAMKAGIDVNLDRKLSYEVPFDSERKAMSVVLRELRGPVMYTKGAPEVVLAKCVGELRDQEVRQLTDQRREELARINNEMASRALRVLALAYRELPHDGAAIHEEQDLVFAGLVGMIDPPREEVKEAVRKCHDAGLRPIMITGDHPATALAIARELGIASATDRAVTGFELGAMSDEELGRRVDGIPVYARVSAEHKLRVVNAWKSRGEVVAMTGDGVNDAPAVKAADIGIAMGIAGTDVTKEASDMVLTDDNFASIVSAVEEGRCIYDNIQKVLQYLLSANAGEIMLMLAASLLGWPAPLLPIQLLWINVVTDGLPALALSLEPPEPDVMRRKPRSTKASVLSLWTGFAILIQGVLIAGAALAAFAIVLQADPESPGQAGRARTAAFCVLVYSELLRALAARSRTLTLWRLGLFSNPYLLGAIGISALMQLSVVLMPYAHGVFESVEHFAWEWMLVALLASIPLAAIELGKVVQNLVSQRGPARRDVKP